MYSKCIHTVNVESHLLKLCASVQALFQEAEALFKEGLVAAAGMKYAESAEGMPLRTQLGGQARLQHAICLDSLGQGQEAHSIYRSLSRHPTSYVAKRANQVRPSLLK